MAAALQIEFDDGRRAMERTAETGVDAFRSAFAPEEYYDIGATADAIRAAGASRVALQFPDHLLGDSAFVIARIQVRGRGGQNASRWSCKAERGPGACGAGGAALRAGRHDVRRLLR